jgi:D-sedoheptulose 7-phosphate isomerase
VNMFASLSFPDDHIRQMAADILTNRPTEAEFLDHMLEKDPALAAAVPALLAAFEALTACLAQGQTLYLCGNGGSCADCMHIAGELVKSFLLHRRLSAANAAKFAHLEFGAELAAHLEEGARCQVLGFNHSLNSAILNDSRRYEMQYAQELYVFGRPGDILLAISTSGNALNVLYAVTTATALGMRSIALTGRDGGKLARSAEIAIKAPADLTYHVQEQHSLLYHALCAMLEARLFGEPPPRAT